MFVYFIFVIAALAYVFTVTHQTNGQIINPQRAAAVDGQAYPDLNWTPGNWFKAVLQLPLASESDAKYLRGWLHVIEGWKWNLIPLLLTAFAVATLSFLAVREDRRLLGGAKGDFSEPSTPTYPEKRRRRFF